MSTSVTPALSAEVIGARMERLPISRWHIKARVIAGAVTFFDGFDQLMIAYSMPQIAKQWHLTSSSIAWMIAVGGIGMLVGALLGGWFADHYGRINVIIVSLVVYSVLSLGMGLTHSLELFVIFRFLQGLGLGAEVPVAASYIGEITKAHGRGRFVLLYETVFPIGLVCSALVASWMVPAHGYRWLFALGALPILLVPSLFRLQESPRWLASRGRLDDATRTLEKIESEVTKQFGTLPDYDRNPPAEVTVRSSFVELFSVRYRRRTAMVATAWLTAYFVNYGIASWLPVLFTRIFKVGEKTALHYSVLTSLTGLVGCLTVAFLIDRLGRRLCISASLGFAALTLFLLAGFGTGSAGQVVLWAAGTALFIFAVNMALYVYTAELYPTRIRAQGCAFGGAAGRLGIIFGPLVVGWVLTASNDSLSWLFTTFGLVAVVGCLVVATFGIETKERTLEEINR
ncbi:MFS transporter [Tsukamurella pseudospumae]|uniref:MFS transporter n=1 Tax=Tsukamurella pseudospumae TaxID=239498 RepID=A0A137ZLA7_9ACTN|nr:MFS transporter [Tsukamurella pseudospumae]KXO98976.1 MFS transporter [Tsukamurella pseudospumae]